MMVAAALFIASLLGLALLFTLKSIESKRERVFVPDLRARADRAALALKAVLIAAREQLERLPPTLLYFTRLALHELALGAARLARIAEAQFHAIADMVSHKRGYEKRNGGTGEPRSEFLKQVQNGLDENKEDGQNAGTQR